MFIMVPHLDIPSCTTPRVGDFLYNPGSPFRSSSQTPSFRRFSTFDDIRVFPHFRFSNSFFLLVKPHGIPWNPWCRWISYFHRFSPFSSFWPCDHGATLSSIEHITVDAARVGMARSPGLPATPFGRNLSHFHHHATKNPIGYLDVSAILILSVHTL